MPLDPAVQLNRGPSLRLSLIAKLQIPPRLVIKASARGWAEDRSERVLDFPKNAFLPDLVRNEAWAGFDSRFADRLRGGVHVFHLSFPFCFRR